MHWLGSIHRVSHPRHMHSTLFNCFTHALTCTQFNSPSYIYKIKDEVCPSYCPRRKVMKSTHLHRWALCKNQESRSQHGLKYGSFLKHHSLGKPYQMVLAFPPKHPKATPSTSISRGTWRLKAKSRMSPTNMLHISQVAEIIKHHTCLKWNLVKTQRGASFLTT